MEQFDLAVDHAWMVQLAKELLAFAKGFLGHLSSSAEQPTAPASVVVESSFALSGTFSGRI
jgi:hypothetical protein